VINVDKNAAYPKAIDSLKADKTLPPPSELRHVLYLNKIAEQDHRFIKKLVNPGMGLGCIQLGTTNPIEVTKQ
jgi:transposase-like protein